MSLLSAATVLALCLAMPAPGAGAATLAVNFDNTGVASGSGPDITIGWAFTTAVPISVSQLGFWDQNANGLIDQHTVAIWSAGGPGTSGDALVTATVAAGTANPLAPDSWFRVVNVAPTLLPAGNYVIGGHLPGQSEPFSELSQVTNYSAAPGITHAGRRFANATGFLRPDNALGGQGAFGPNFTFEAVPEPSSAALTAFGLAGLTVHRLRRRKQSR